MTGDFVPVEHGRLVAEADGLLRDRPIEIPGPGGIRQAAAVWAHLDTAPEPDDLFRLTVTLFPIHQDAAALAGAWLVLGRKGDPIRRGQVDGGGQCVIRGLTAGSWRALLLPPAAAGTDQVAGGPDQDPRTEPWQDPAELLRRAATGDAVVVCEAVDALGRQRVTEAVPVLVDLLGHPEPIVRQAAAEALGEIGEPTGVDRLIQTIEDSRPFVQLAAVETLGRLGDRRAVQPLIAVLEDGDRDPAVREAAAEALILLNDSRAVDPLRRAADNAGSPRDEVSDSAEMTEATRPSATRKPGLREPDAAEPGGPAPAAPLGTPPPVDPDLRELLERFRERLDAEFGNARLRFTTRDRVGRVPYRPVTEMTLLSAESQDWITASHSYDTATLDQGSRSDRPNLDLATAVEQALRRLGTIDVAVGAAAQHEWVGVFVHPDPRGEAGDTVVQFEPGREFQRLRLALHGTGPIPRLHPGELDEDGQVTLRGVPYSHGYELRLRTRAGGRPVLRPMWTEVAARGAAAEVTEPQPTRLAVLCDREGRSVTIERDRPGSFVVEVSGLDITDRDIVMELPIHARRRRGSSHRLVALLAPLRWDHRTDRCTARLRLDSGDLLEEDEGPRALRPTQLTAAWAEAVRVSAARATGLTVDAWDRIADRTTTDPDVHAAIRRARDERDR